MADEKLNTTPADAPATENPAPGKVPGQATAASEPVSWPGLQIYPALSAT